VGLKEIQEQFVKLSVDKDTREKVFDPDSKLSGDFNDQELSLKRHAFSLIRKRLGVVKGIFSNTRAILGDVFDEEFVKYANASDPPVGLNRHRKDAINFADWLIEETTEISNHKGINVLLSHELVPVHMWMSKKRFSFRFYLRNPSQLLFLSKEFSSISKARISPTIMIWREAPAGSIGYQWRSYSL
tara:strand:- start:62 stop:622 length:561 start_codon:yes stop_codon:yes gene_type:complete